MVNINALFAERSIAECDYFQILLLGILSRWNPLFIFRYADTVTGAGVLYFGKYIFPQLQTCTALNLFVDCTDVSCSSNIVIFNNFSFLNFPFLNFED